MSQPIEIIVPRLGWSMEEGAFVAWHKKDGEVVRAGEALFSIEGDKAIQEIESIDSGILRISKNAPKPGDPIKVGDILGHLLSEKPAAPRVVSKVEQPIPPAPPTPSQPPPVAVPRSEPAISPRAVRIAAELGVDWQTLKGSGRSGRIRERDIRAAVIAPKLTQSANGTEPVVLVTGGCGFIGTWVVRELLRRGLRVVVLDAIEKPARWYRVIGPPADAVPLVRGSLLNRELLAYVFAAHGITHLIHLAALLIPACQADPWEGCQINVLGTVALFEQVRKSSPPLQGFSYASSIAVFDDETKATSDHENSTTFYGAFKRSVELIAAQYWKHFRIASLGIRPQVAYGPERDSGLTAGPSLAARAAAQGESFCIGYTGQVGYDYVEDIATAFVRGALETPAGSQIVDLMGESAEVDQVVAAIRAVVPGSKLSINGPRIPSHLPLRRNPFSTLYADWKTTSLVEGIRRTVDFYRT